MKLIIEAVIVGLSNAFIWTVVSNIYNYNKTTDLLVSVFITGILLHIICEYSGINRWYCKNGNACQ